MAAFGTLKFTEEKIESRIFKKAFGREFLLFNGF